MITPLSAANSLSLKQLAYLVALSETLNFTRAAERCFVTQSTLSGGIRELEEALGAPLFERDRQHVGLTPMGEELSRRARALLADAVDLIQWGRTASNPMAGTVTLGAIPTIAPFLLPPLLRSLRKTLPGLQVLLREAQTQDLLELIQEGEMDFALIALPMEVGRLEVKPLFQEPLWLVSSKQDPVARLDAPALNKLDLEHLMLLGEGHCLRDHVLTACQRAQRGRAQAPSAVEASSLPTLVQMVEAGLGLTLLPEMAVRSALLTGSGVVAHRLAAPVPHREIALVTRPTTTRRALLEKIQAIAHKLGPAENPS